MKSICWPAWISAVAMVTFVLLASGCQASEPLVPREIYQQVNDDGREWTYDTAWQNIRKLNADIESGEISSLESQALFVVSQMERLENGKATSLSSSSWSAIVEAERIRGSERTRESNQKELLLVARSLVKSFDAGDFEKAKADALSLYGLTQSLKDIARPEEVSAPPLGP